MGVAMLDGLDGFEIWDNVMGGITWYSLDIENNGHIFSGVPAGVTNGKIHNNKFGPIPYGRNPSSHRCRGSARADGPLVHRHRGVIGRRRHPGVEYRRVLQREHRPGVAGLPLGHLHVGDVECERPRQRQTGEAMTVEGIDVSHHQSTTPGLSGLGFLFARKSIGTQQDEKYGLHIGNARRAGLLTGAYHFNWSPISVADQVRAFLANAGDVDFYALDVEPDSGTPAFSRTQARDFIARVQDTGRECGFYMSESSFFDAGQDWNWIANWSNRPSRPLPLLAVPRRADRPEPLRRNACTAPRARSGWISGWKGGRRERLYRPWGAQAIHDPQGSRALSVVRPDGGSAEHRRARADHGRVPRRDSDVGRTPRADRLVRLAERHGRAAGLLRQ
jgi:hypothetical protein